jgi:radical SAM protein with 4Fe4S-binding SPASM domain
MCYEWGETGIYTNLDGPRRPAMLVDTGFDSIRVSLDGPREIDDRQRGAGSYDKAMAGIQALAREKRAAGSRKPLVSISYTVTPENHLAIEDLFLRDLDLSPIGWVTIQMQNFLTEGMGEDYARLLASKFGLEGEHYWRSMVRTPEDFAGMDRAGLARQVEAVRSRLRERDIALTLLPQTFSAESLDAYLGARWSQMADRYDACTIPWLSADITATGELAPCHIFFDLVMGSLHEHSFTELWNGEAYRRFRAHLRERGLLSICSGCCILYLANQRA